MPGHRVWLLSQGMLWLRERPRADSPRTLFAVGIISHAGALWRVILRGNKVLCHASRTARLGAADRGEYRQAVGAGVEVLALKRAIQGPICAAPKQARPRGPKARQQFRLIETYQLP
jgi:hypothetical protein